MKKLLNDQEVNGANLEAKIGGNEAEALLKIDKMLNPGKNIVLKSNTNHSWGVFGQVYNVKRNNELDT